MPSFCVGDNLGPHTSPESSSSLSHLPRSTPTVLLLLGLAAVPYPDCPLALPRLSSSCLVFPATSKESSLHSFCLSVVFIICSFWHSTFWRMILTNFLTFLCNINVLFSNLHFFFCSFLNSLWSVSQTAIQWGLQPPVHFAQATEQS